LDAYSFVHQYDSNNPHILAYVELNQTDYPYTYDDNGNITEGPHFADTAYLGTRSFEYNADNMPTRITTADDTVDFVYDGSGIRVKKVVNGSDTTYYVGGHYEIEADGTPTKYIFAGNMRIAMMKGSTIYRLHKDHLGSTIAITDTNGAVVESADYLPYGGDTQPPGITLTNYKYTDQEFDPETALYNYVARLYDPVIGRFMTPDSIVPNPYDPQSLNRYAYARNNPLYYTDPSGQSFFGIDLLIGAAIGAAIGGTTSAVTGGDIFEGMLTGAIVGWILRCSRRHH